MKALIIYITYLLCFLTCSLFRKGNGDQFAVLIAGSRGYFNYRHHADVCHAYHTLIARGFPEENIITFMYDDVANDQMNPFKGKIFNKPSALGGFDVNKGCKKSYTGSEVNIENFLNVIQGFKNKVNGPVLKSTDQDDVFINFVDHGAPGIVAFPEGDELHAEQLMSAFKIMQHKKMFKKLVFYLEACESGSMFTNLSKSGSEIYAVTASNGRESSWGTYCPPTDDIIDGVHLNTCLGDEFSVNWIEDTDNEATSETLESQYLNVKAKTTKSHVLQLGDVEDIAKEQIGNFLGRKYPINKKTEHLKSKSTKVEVDVVDSRNIPLISKFYQYLNTGTQEALNQLNDELLHRKKIDDLFKEIVTLIIGSDNNDLITSTLNGKITSNSSSIENNFVNSNWFCHRTAHNFFKKECTSDGKFSEYSLKYSSTLLSLCDQGLSITKILEAITQACRKDSNVEID